jgi:hypothetical protein
MERKIPLRRVIGKLRSAAIHDIVAEKNPDVPRGDKSFPGLFQHALTAYMADLSPEELEEMEQTRQEWQSSGPPIDVRLK